MTYTVVALLPRRPDITPSQFRAHYEDVHVPLLKSLVGPHFPLTHTRNYVSRRPVDQGPSSLTASTATGRETAGEHFPPTVMYQGVPSDVQFDSLTVMTWEDEQAWLRFLEAFRSADVARKIGEDEDKFIHRGRKVVFPIQEPVETTTR
jgi:hypothetical protein